MSAPDLAVTVEPTEAGAVVYLPLAARTNKDKPSALLTLRLMITNTGGSPVHLNTVALSFTAPPSVSPVSIATNLDIAPADTQEWNFDPASNVILPVPAPSSFALSLSCDGFSAPAQVDLPLAAYQLPGGGYRFPGALGIFLTGEFWQGAGGVHGAGAWGSQLFGYDMGVVAFDQTTSSWSALKPGTTGDQNQDLRVWGQPIFAMADGSVLEAVNDVPNNPHPLKWTSDADLQQQMTDQMTKYWGSFQHGGAGNHFYLQHGDNVVLYAHMQKGSLNPSLLIPGTPVQAGDFLGLAGNAGNSTAPHLHIHAVKSTIPETGPLRPIPFHDILAIDISALASPYPGSPWAKVQGQGLPHVTSAVWPALGWVSRPNIYEVAIDPLALILSNDVYVKLTLPDPPPFESIERQIRDLVSEMTHAERRRALARVQAFRATYLSALERQLTAPPSGR